MQIDFAPPADYVEPVKPPPTPEPAEETKADEANKVETVGGFKFVGKGRTLSESDSTPPAPPVKVNASTPIAAALAAASSPKKAWTGAGKRLDGKALKPSQQLPKVDKKAEEEAAAVKRRKRQAAAAARRARNQRQRAKVRTGGTFGRTQKEQAFIGSGRKLG